MMRIGRRSVVAGLALAPLAGCVSTGGGAAVRAPAMRAVDNPGWSDWVARYAIRARGRGIEPSVIEAAFRDAGYLPGVIERDRNQTEFVRSFEDYLNIAASDARVAQGRGAARREAGTLSRVSSRFGVQPEVVAAIWGLESFYGDRRGDIPVISATSTLAYDGRRGAFFESQVTAALRILQAGDTTPSRLVGSWAGAMGHTQFIPTTYIAHAVDFTGDGRRDIWAEDPTDALASAAAYLAASGWRRGQPWGLEVRLPDGFAGPFGRGTTRSPATWAAAGVRSATGGALPQAGAASILAPAGAGGPAFLVFRNFSVILRYNNSETYALGIGHLSDRIAGRGPIRAAFPPDRFGLTSEDRKALQRGLSRAGFDAGTADGVLGPQTEAAITAYQRARGLAVTGQPSRALLERVN